MDDVFHYNSGSLLQALNPDQTLVDLSDQDWVSTSPTTSRRSSRPTRASTARRGDVVRRRRDLQQEGLRRPRASRSRRRGMSSSRTARRSRPPATASPRSCSPTATPGRASCSCSATSPTSRAQDPKWAEQYTANDPSAKYVDEPALAGFANQQEVVREGPVQRGLRLDDQRPGAECARRPARAPSTRCSSATIAQCQQDNPDNVNDIGVFALPAADAATTRRSRSGSRTRSTSPKTDRGRQARRRQEVRGLRQLARRLRRAERRGLASGSVRDHRVHAARATCPA